MSPPPFDVASLPHYEWLDIPAWVFDPLSLRTIWANAAGCAFWNADTLEELRARELAGLGDRARERLALAAQAHARGEVRRESWTIFPGGQPVTAWLASRGILLEDGRQAILFVAERRQAKTDAATRRLLEAAKRAIDNMNLAKSSFLAHVSHEIRTPMNGVLGLTQLALRSPMSERQRRYVSLAHQSAKGLMATVSELLDLAKVEAGRVTVERAPFGLRESIETALSPLRVAGSQKGLKMTLRIDAALPEHAIGDAGRLRQVLVNLVDNALKFTATGSIQVELEPATVSPPDAEALWLLVNVRDTGIGLSPEQITQLFQPFAAAAPAVERRAGGDGLGLTIVARLVKLMGGEVWVTSAPGEGSCFSFTVRLARVAG
jgi:signal transduction histidine kinase